MLFFALYPGVQNIKEGMMQRVNSVDHLFQNIPRTYISCSLWTNFKKKVTRPAENVIYIELNTFVHGIAIIKEIRQASVIYIHSIFNCLPLFLFSPFLRSSLKRKVIALDLHGIVPEELKFNELKKSYYLFKKVERWTFKNINKAVFVTKAMQSYLLSKYPNYKGQSIVFNIYPKIIDNSNNNEIIKGIDTEKIIVIYSGNLSKWQNIDLMLESIKANISDKFEFVILTGDKANFEKTLLAHELTDKVKLLSLNPDELPAIYKIANYGFVLRTDMPINNVANPTKLIEYLHFGIIPIVLSEKIGDFYTMGYEYVALNDFSDQLPKSKSVRNKELAAQIERQNQQADLYSFILDKSVN